MDTHYYILKRVAENDKRAFSELYNLFSDKVYNTAISYVQHQNDAEEITQDVFVSIFRNASKFKGNSSVSTWIYKITVNTSLNYVRKKGRMRWLQFGNERLEKTDFDHPGVLLENKENAKELFRLIKSLPDNQKTAIILSFVEDLPRKKVAEIMDISLKAVESLLQRGKKNLKKKLETKK